MVADPMKSAAPVASSTGSVPASLQADPAAQATEAPQVAPKPKTPDQLATEVVSHLPELAAVRSQLRTLIMLAQLYPPGSAVDQETALLELATFQKLTPGLIAKAADEVEAVLGKVHDTIATEFEGKTGTRPDTYADFKKRYEEERAEQLGLMAWAEQLLKDVGLVAAQLGQTNPVPGLQRASTGPKINPGRVLLGALVRVDILRPAVQEGPSPVEPPSWRTPPILVEADDEITRLRLIQRRLAASSVADVLTWLSGIGMNPEVQKKLFRSLADKALRQQGQSHEILDNVAEDNQAIAARLDVAEGARQTIEAVRKVFVPEKPAVVMSAPSRPTDDRIAKEMAALKAGTRR